MCHIPQGHSRNGVCSWGVFVPTFVAAHRVTPCLGHHILMSPLPWLPHPGVIPSLHQDWGATWFPQSWLFPMGMHSHWEEG